MAVVSWIGWITTPEHRKNYVKLMESNFSWNPMKLRFSARDRLRTIHSWKLRIRSISGHSLFPPQPAHWGCFFVYTLPSHGLTNGLEIHFQNGYIFRYIPVLLQTHLHVYQLIITVLRCCFSVFYCVMGTHKTYWFWFVISRSAVRFCSSAPSSSPCFRGFFMP